LSGNLNIPNSVIGIDMAAFSNCINLSNVTFGGKLNYIGPSAFYGCKSLKSIKIPTNVFEIDNFAFAYCEGLVDVEVPYLEKASKQTHLSAAPVWKKPRLIQI
jgi:hypothetical protein